MREATPNPRARSEIIQNEKTSQALEQAEDRSGHVTSLEEQAGVRLQDLAGVEGPVVLQEEGEKEKGRRHDPTAMKTQALIASPCLKVTSLA